jgi:inorganic triphosphatase YgiF
MVETEAKFVIRDRMGFQALRGVRKIGGFSLLDNGSEHVRDVYMDTSDRKYLAAGYACRLRERDAEYFITLKSISTGEGGVHRRTELEERISDPGQATRPELWPDGPARELATRIGRGVVLGALCELRQHRWKRAVKRSAAGLPGASAAHALFELSLDEVKLPALLYCLEVEMLPAANVADLKELVALLRKSVPLQTDPRSKLEHALSAAGIPFAP